MVTQLNTEIRKRIGSIKLKQMTNEDPSINTINDTVLDSSCIDAMAVFSRITGYEFDVLNPIHVQICCDGVLCFLEKYKSRDGNIVSMNTKNFYSACEKYRAMAYVTPMTSLEYNLEPQPSNPKMLIPIIDKQYIEKLQIEI